jgi:hypothetical protein
MDPNPAWNWSMVLTCQRVCGMVFQVMMVHGSVYNCIYDLLLTVQKGHARRVNTQYRVFSWREEEYVIYEDKSWPRNFIFRDKSWPRNFIIRDKSWPRIFIFGDKSWPRNFIFGDKSWQRKFIIGDKSWLRNFIFPYMTYSSSRQENTLYWVLTLRACPFCTVKSKSYIQLKTEWTNLHLGYHW